LIVGCNFYGFFKNYHCFLRLVSHPINGP
jgi:hypothetical protein